MQIGTEHTKSDSFSFKSYGTKTKLAIVSGLIFGLVIYNYAVKNTINMYHENLALKKENFELDHYNVSVADYRRKQMELERIISSSNKKDSVNQEKVLEVINKYKQIYNLKLVDFGKPETDLKNKYKFELYKITLEGGYSDLLKTTYAIEQKNNIGHVISVNYSVHKDYNSKISYLTSSIYLQIVNANEGISD